MARVDNAERRHAGDPPDSRNPFERDRDRVLYTSALRRLAETTQVFPASAGHVVHNRLTHTLEVAQIARRTAERLAAECPAIEPGAAEAAALAHDLGHPPFGHTGERALDAALQRLFPAATDGFEGNAQSFRIIVRLAACRPEFRGLNLTLATQRGILKYPWRQGEGSGSKFGAYRAEDEDFEWCRRNAPPGRRDLQADIVDFADDVAYSVHDVADFFRAGLIPLEVLSRDPAYLAESVSGVGVSRAESEVAFEGWLADFPLDRPFTGGFEQRAALRRLASRWIADFVHEGISLDSGEAVLSARHQCGLATLKALTARFVFRDPELASIKAEQGQLVSTITAALSESARTDGRRLGVEGRELLEQGQQPDRVVADTVAGLTEAEATALYDSLDMTA